MAWVTLADPAWEWTERVRFMVGAGVGPVTPRLFRPAASFFLVGAADGDVSGELSRSEDW